jgi:hypothetical protein
MNFTSYLQSLKKFAPSYSSKDTSAAPNTLATSTGPSLDKKIEEEQARLTDLENQLRACTSGSTPPPELIWIAALELEIKKTRWEVKKMIVERDGNLCGSEWELVDREDGEGDEMFVDIGMERSMRLK